MVICLEQGEYLHMAQLMQLPLTVSCFSKIQIGFTFLVPAYLGSPRRRAVKWVCVCEVNVSITSVSIRELDMVVYHKKPLCNIQFAYNQTRSYICTLVQYQAQVLALD